jgi:catechol 2,3-dioxygenase-like lactoylglutathione lyase family enzyme
MTAELKFGHIEIFSGDPLRLKDFYVDALGFELIEIQEGKYVWLASNGKEILIRPGKKIPPAENYQSTNMAFVIYTDDLDKALKKLGEKDVEIKGTDGSDKCITFTDTDGNWIQLVNPEDH